MSERKTGYDWAQALFNVASSASADLPTLVKEAGLDPLAGDVADIDLSGVDLSGQDLAGWDLKYASWNGAKLTGTKLRGAKIDLAALTKAENWQQAELDKATRDEIFQLTVKTTDKRELIDKRAMIAAEKDKPREINARSLRTYLNKKLYKDGRMSEFSYEWTANLLGVLGFRTYAQIDQCIDDYDGATLGWLATFDTGGNRQGQIKRFEYMLLAGMGQLYLERHPWAKDGWFRKRNSRVLRTFQKYKLKIGSYDPLAA